MQNQNHNVNRPKFTPHDNFKPTFNHFNQYQRPQNLKAIINFFPRNHHFIQARNNVTNGAPELMDFVRNYFF